VRERWDCDHVIPRAITGKDTLKEFKPIHYPDCHQAKTKEDLVVIKKSRNVMQKALGLKKKSNGGFRGWRRFNGDVVFKKR